MKKILVTLALLATVTISNALEWQTCIEYVTKDDPTAEWQLAGKADQVWITEWKSTVTQPTEVELQAVEATAIAWKTDVDDTETADFDDWTKREKAMMKVVLKMVNQLRVLHGLNEYTAAQVKTALQAEM